MSEKKSEIKMSVLCEASDLVRQIAAPATGKAALVRAYRRLGTWTYNRVKDVYYADKGVRISGEEIDKLRAMAGKKEVASSDPSIAELRGQLAVVVRHLQRIDPSFIIHRLKRLAAWHIRMADKSINRAASHAPRPWMESQSAENL